MPALTDAELILAQLQKLSDKLDTLNHEVAQLKAQDRANQRAIDRFYREDWAPVLARVERLNDLVPRLDSIDRRLEHIEAQSRRLDEQDARIDTLEKQLAVSEAVAQEAKQHAQRTALGAGAGTGVIATAILEAIRRLL